MVSHIERIKKFLILCFSFFCINVLFSLPADTVRYPSLLWVKQLSSPIYTKPIVKDDLLYFADLDNYVYALYPDSASILWKKRLAFNASDDMGPKGIKSNFVFYKSSLIVVTVGGLLYSLDSRTGKDLWSTIDLGDEVHSSPVLFGSYLFVVTAKRGRLFIINAGSGEVILKKFIGFAVETTPSINTVEMKRGKSLIILYNVYITLRNKLLFFRIHLDEKAILDVTTLAIVNESRYVSSPIIHTDISNRNIKRNTLFFATKDFLYSINADLLEINWVVRSDAILINKDRKHYPSPSVIDGMLFFSNRAYDKDLGSLLWKVFLYGDLTTDVSYSESFVYFGGSYVSQDGLLGYIAFVDRKTESIVFHNPLSTFPLSPITVSEGTLYFSTEGNKLYAFR